jgi:hypothetical protein
MSRRRYNAQSAFLYIGLAGTRGSYSSYFTAGSIVPMWNP